jgi:hypothetical protein
LRRRAQGRRRLRRFISRRGMPTMDGQSVISRWGRKGNPDRRSRSDRDGLACKEILKGFGAAPPELVARVRSQPSCALRCDRRVIDRRNVRRGNVKSAPVISAPASTDPTAPWGRFLASVGVADSTTTAMGLFRGCPTPAPGELRRRDSASDIAGYRSCYAAYHRGSRFRGRHQWLLIAHSGRGR